MPVYRFLCCTDSHLSPEVQDAYFGGKPYESFSRFANFARESRTHYEAIIHLGDLAHDRLPNTYKHYEDLLQGIPLPFYPTPGNHDDRDSVRKLASPNISLLSPSPRIDYAVELPDLSLLFLDSQKTESHVAGNLLEEQLSALKQYLNTSSKPFSVFLHHPLWPLDCGWMESFMFLENAEELHALLVDHRSRLIGVFSGHVHNASFQVVQGISYVTLPSLFCGFSFFPESKEYQPHFHALSPFVLLSIDTEKRSFLVKEVFV